jgi:hypothetical protein
MKSSAEVIECVARRIRDCLERPQHFAPNAVALEEVLIILDAIEQFVRDEPGLAPALHNASYADFLRMNGFGTNTIALSRVDTLSHSEDAAAMEEVVNYWRVYRKVRPALSPYVKGRERPLDPSEVKRDVPPEQGPPQ